MAGLVASMQFCIDLDWSKLVSLRLFCVCTVLDGSRWVCGVLHGFGLGSAGLAAFVLLCMVYTGSCCVCIMLCSFGVVSAGLPALVLLCVVLAWSRWDCVVLCGSGLVSAGLVASMQFLC